ncbi:MARVEL domain-containing protein [Madurella fahalii]|uniref:MARVEL domain-containing protein n=1 Tax=Madurella fahalii TaxID=1157608 RepID=A0ABQ0G3P1_9PEZI
MAIGGMTLGYLLFSVLHIAQFALAITVCALYGVELDRARKAGAHAEGKWVYAEVVGGLSALTAILYCIPFILRFALVWAWNLILFILWIVLFGLFSRMYINQDVDGNADIQRMKNAVWVVLANAILWLIGTLAHFIYWWGHRERRSRFTSRAKL